MLFVPLHPPYTPTLIRKQAGREITASTPFSGDMAASAVASVYCRLSLLAGHLDSFWDLSFGIRVVAIDRGDFDELDTQDREEARNYIPESMRSRVMDFVADGACAAVDVCDPDGVIITTRETFRASDQEETPKWIRKYLLLINRLHSHGYYVDRENRSEKNQQVWYLTNR